MNRTSPLVRAGILGVVGLGAVAVVGYGFLFDLPMRLSDAPGLTVAERIESQNSIRGTLVQALGGLFVVGGLIFTARTFQATREGQITDRYTAAINQLGHQDLHVRLGGIYALERIARDSDRDRPTITSVLCAYVRSGPPSVASSGPRADVRAAIEVIGRLPGADAPRSLDLRGAHLDGIRLPDARLAGADLSGAQLSRAQLPGADLRGARLGGATLQRATLTGSKLAHGELTPDVDLSGATCAEVDLRSAQLDGANLAGAHLSGSDLRDAHFTRAKMGGAVLQADLPRQTRTGGAVFSGAELLGANLRGVDLHAAEGLSSKQRGEAVSDDQTRWPIGIT